MRWDQVSWRRTVVLGLTWLCICVARVSGAAPPDPVLVNYACGVNSAYGALRLLGRPVEYDRLLTREYISTCQGSTLRDLKVLVERYGAIGLPVENMDVDTLRHLGLPVLLNVKSSPESRAYDHWVLCVPWPDGQLRAFDAPSTSWEVVPRDLSAIWSGVGLVVSNHAVDSMTIVIPSLRRCVPWTTGVLAVVLALRFVRRRMYGTRGARTDRHWLAVTVLQAGGLLLLATTTGFCVSVLDESGFLNQSRAIGAIEQAHFSDLVPRITVGRAKEMMASGAIAIDARMTSDYEAAHVDNAINIPVGASADERRAAVAGIQKSRPLVVYCQSRNCAFGDHMAKALAEDGYRDISIMTDGWAGWNATVPR